MAARARDRIDTGRATKAPRSAVAPRVAAIAIDGVILIPTQIAGLIILGNLILTLDDLRADIDAAWLVGAAAVVAAALAPVLYFSLLHAGRWQATVGKRMLGMALVRDGSGEPPRLGRTTLRAVVFMLTVYAAAALALAAFTVMGGTTLVLFLLILLIAGAVFLVPATVRSDHRCIHDLIAATMVIDDPRRRERT